MIIPNLTKELDELEASLKELEEAKKEDPGLEHLKEDLLEKTFKELRQRKILTILPAVSRNVHWSIILSIDGRSLDEHHDYGKVSERYLYSFNSPEETRSILMEADSNLSQEINERQKQKEALAQALEQFKKNA